MVLRGGVTLRGHAQSNVTNFSATAASSSTPGLPPCPAASFVEARPTTARAILIAGHGTRDSGERHRDGGMHRVRGWVKGEKKRMKRGRHLAPTPSSLLLLAVPPSRSRAGGMLEHTITARPDGLFLLPARLFHRSAISFPSFVLRPALPQPASPLPLRHLLQC